MSAARTSIRSPEALLKDRIRRLFRELPGALAGEEEPVHQVRVAGRRLRVALPLLTRKAGGRRLRRADRILRDLTRAAGTGRDLDVQVALYEEHLGSLERVSPEQRKLLRRMKAARGRSRRTLAAGILDLDIDGLRRKLRRIRSRGSADADAVLERTRSATEDEGAVLLEGLAAVGDRYDPEALHALRRRIRRLRYTAEVEEALGSGQAKASALWKKLQEAIGNLHDAHVLATWFARQKEKASARGQTFLAAAAEAERAAFEARGHRLHRTLLEEGPEGLATRALGVPVQAGTGGNGQRKRKRSSTRSSASSTPRLPLPRGRRASPTLTSP
jgi:CHAD domain-containing protein